MSKPPRPHYRFSTTENAARSDAFFEYAPLKFSELVELERSIGETEDLNAPVATTGAEGDFARTLFELSALIGHALAMYQDLYAAEAWIGTAKSDVSLVHHAGRLAYQPDIGVAATGYVVLTIGDGLEGTLPERFSLASVPRGEIKAQDYETLAGIDVKAAWNQILPLQATQPAVIDFGSGGSATFRVSAIGLDLQEGEPILLMSSTQRIHATVRTAVETRGETHLTAEALANTVLQTTGLELYAKASEVLHVFGWNAPASQFSPSAIRTSGAYTAPTTGDSVGTVRTGYTVTKASGGYAGADVYLDRELADSLAQTWVLAYTTGWGVFEVRDQQSASVQFSRGEVISIPTITVTNGVASSGSTNRVVETSISGTVSALQLYDTNGVAVNRSALAVPAAIHGAWGVRASVAATEPNPAAAIEPLELSADLTGMRPGRTLAFSSIDGSRSQIVELRKLEISGTGTSFIYWNALQPLTITQPWTLGDLVVLGNVPRISHGESVQEILGGSDGITPFLRFELKKTPLTMLPGTEGAEPALEIAVNEVAWTRVEDFSNSSAADRHYRLETREEQKAFVVFGNGQQGAIPPSGRKHISAQYRKGLGTLGNAAPGQISRIRKSHPLVEAALNRTDVSGGANPASLEDVRTQATRYVRTFDRAVSVQDYADLALLFPGIARAASRWSSQSGVRLVVAGADGSAPPALAELRAFLDARRDTEMPLTLADPIAVDVYLSLTLESHPDYLVENVRIAVQDRLYATAADAPPGMFVFAARDFGQAAHLSEVYEAVEGVEGVTYVRVTRFALTPGAVVFDLLEANQQQWLRLQPQNLDISITTGGTA